MSTYQTTLKDNSGNELLPKTVLKAIADDNGYYLDSALTAADINALKNGTLNNAVRHNNEIPGTPPSINAGQLNGHYDSYFATESEIDIVRGQSQAYDPSETYDIGDYAIHTDILYRCLNNGVTGVFDATKWEVVDLTTLKDEVETNKTDIATNTAALTSLNQAVSVSIQQPVTKLIDTISFSEYCYYSKFGRLVIVDIGGVSFPTAPSNGTAWLDGLPVQRTRPVAELFNNSDRTKSIDVYGEVGKTQLKVTRAIASTSFWGQIIYLTD